MKLKGEPRTGRGSRPMKGVELLRSPEERSESAFQWFDPAQQVELIQKMVSGIPDEPVELPNDKNFFQALLEFRYYLSVLCATKPELYPLVADEMADLAHKAFTSTLSGRKDPKGWLAGKYNSKIRQRLNQVSPERLRGDLAITEDEMNALDFAFGVKIGASQQMRWIARGIQLNPEAYASDESGVLISNAAAKLLLLFPARREVLLLK